MKRIRNLLFILIILVVALFLGYQRFQGVFNQPETSQSAQESVIAEEQSDVKPVIPDLSKIPPYNGSPVVEINGNKPSFTEEDLTTEPFERYSKLDKLGRCGTAYANVCPSIMPNEERGSISEIHPSGWQNDSYPDLIEGELLFNRCHLIAHSLAGEDANEKNLITGTRYLNVEGMQPYELDVLEYVRGTGNHVLYRVTPGFEGDNLVASGVVMEGLSVEDHGAAVCFHVYAYNVQPGVIIDYKTGESKLDPDYNASASETEQEEEARDKTEEDTIGNKSNTQTSEELDHTEEVKPEDSYVLNTNTHKFHRPSCDSVADMKDKNKIISENSREEIIRDGYEPCGRCKP